MEADPGTQSYGSRAELLQLAPALPEACTAGPGATSEVQSSSARKEETISIYLNPETERNTREQEVV